MSLPIGRLMEVLVLFKQVLLSHGKALTHWKTWSFIWCTCVSSPFIWRSVNAHSTSLCLHPFSYQRLTSYVAKVFSMAYYLVDIDINIICGAIKWVIMNSQKADGRFMEIGHVHHGEMMVCTWSYMDESLITITLVVGYQAIGEQDFGCKLTLVYM